MPSRIAMRNRKKFCALLLTTFVASALGVATAQLFPASARRLHLQTHSGGIAQYQRYESQNPAFGLLKPADWRVRPEVTSDSMAISVSNPAGTLVVQTLFLANSMHADAIATLGAQVKKAKTQYPDLNLSEVVECRNRYCITATEIYTLNGKPVKAKYYVQSDPQQIVIRSIRAPLNSFDAQRNLLLEIMANIRLGKPSNRLVPVPQEAGTPPPAETEQAALVKQQAPDGSVSLDVPANWNVQADNGNMNATNATADVGVVFSNFRVMPNGDIRGGQANVIVSPYQSSASFIMPIFNRWGYRNAKILYSAPNRLIMGSCPGGFGGRCDATDFTMSWVSPQGVPCMGGFTVINGPAGANGQWNSSISGAWAPANNYGYYTPTLSRIGRTFWANKRYGGYYAPNSMAGLRFLQASRGQYTASQRNWAAQQMVRDNAGSRWDDYNRGNINWITQMEGGAYYGGPGPRGAYGAAPSDYIMFNGPRGHYPSETMREMNNLEMQQMMMH
jgi:hypothetical protein